MDKLLLIENLKDVIGIIDDSECDEAIDKIEDIISELSIGGEVL